MASRPGDFSPQVVPSVTTSRPGGASGRCALGYPPQRTAVHPLTMPRSRLRPVPALLAALFLLSCGGHRIEPQNLRPSAPAANGGRPVSDPPPSRIVLHATVFREARIRKMPESLPRHAEGDAQVFAGQTVHYTWQREPVTLQFDPTRVVVGVVVNGRFNLLGERTLPPTLSLAREAPLTPGLHG